MIPPPFIRPPHAGLEVESTLCMASPPASPSLFKQVDRGRPLQLPLLALHLHTPAATAQQDYSHVAALDNTLNDADDVAAKFEAMGCDVMGQASSSFWERRL